MKLLENTKPRRRTVLSMAIGSAVLAACGGGGGSAAPAPSDGSGGQLPPPAAPVAVPKAWQGAQSVEFSSDQAQNAQVAVNADGLGYAVWSQTRANGIQFDVLASRYQNGAWGAPQLVNNPTDTNIADDANPRVVVNASGEALVAWVAELEGIKKILYSRTSEGQFTPQLAIPGVTNHASEVQMAGNAKGDAMLVWRESVGSNPGESAGIWASHFNGLDSFEAPELLDGNSPDTTAPRVAVGEDGNALVVWEQIDLLSAVIYAKAYVAGNWLKAVQLDDGEENRTPSVAIGPGNKAMVAWSRKAGSILPGAPTKNILARYSTNFSDPQAWLPASRLEADDVDDALSPQTTMDALGNATVVWQRSTNPNTILATRSNLFANRFDGSAWLGAQLLDGNSNGSGNPSALQIASDAKGNAVVVWQQLNDTSNAARSDIFSSRLSADAPTQWSKPELIEADDAGDASSPQIAMGAGGNALAVWAYKNGPRGNPLTIQSIKANVFK
jgi:hypothetical protein